MPAPKWLTDGACANKEMVAAFRMLSKDCTEMGKMIGSRTAAARPWNAKGKAYTKAANCLAALQDQITPDSLPQLEQQLAADLDEDCMAKVRLYLSTGELMTGQEMDEWEMQAEGYEAR